MKHLTAFRKAHPGMSLRDAMKGAKKTYKSSSHLVKKAVHKMTKKRRRSGKRRKGRKSAKRTKKRRRRRRR